MIWFLLISIVRSFTEISAKDPCMLYLFVLVNDCVKNWTCGSVMDK